jgi:pilus assembly protein TadC
MPSKNRRMMLTLTPELAKAFDEFREATGTAPASFVVSMLVEAIPAINAITQASKALAKNQDHAMSIMQDVLSDALHQGTAVQLDMYEKKALRKARTEKPSK